MTIANPSVPPALVARGQEETSARTPKTKRSSKPAAKVVKADDGQAKAKAIAARSHLILSGEEGRQALDALAEVASQTKARGKMTQSQASQFLTELVSEK